MFWFAVSTLASVGSSLYSSKQASTEARYNARVKEQQARMIDEQIKLSDTQWNRDINRSSSTLVSLVAGAGITFSGSPVNALLDMTTQMQMDKSIAKYNLEVQKFGVQSEADAFYRQAKSTKSIGYANAFSKALSAGYEYYDKFKPAKNTKLISTLSFKINTEGGKR